MNPTPPAITTTTPPITDLEPRPAACSNLPLADRATIIPWLYTAVDLGSTPGNYERCALAGGGWRMVAV